MRRTKASLILVACLLLPLSGCMTLMSEESGPFAGTRTFVEQYPMKTYSPYDYFGLVAVGGTLFNVFAPFDLPLSFALDTLLLPGHVVCRVVSR